MGRWARAAGTPNPRAVQALRAAVRAVVAKLAKAGAVDDAAFAESRARSLTRAGRSRRAVDAHLATRGIAPETRRAALPDNPEAEFLAALACARRRRIGPFRKPGDPDPTARPRELGILARAGFAQDVALRALGTTPEAAEALVDGLRRGESASAVTG